MLSNYSLLNDKKRRSKYLVLGPGEQRTFRLSSRTPRIPFNVLSRTSNELYDCNNCFFKLSETFILEKKITKIQKLLD